MNRAALRAAIFRLDKVPASAQPGDVVSYRLQLQSIGTADVRLDPCLRFGAFSILQPSIGIGDTDTVQHVDEI